ncbi:MAG: response regulator [Lachnospiraceae bacterium]|nr:response regulator [Lachnospiraceae bacterium]
MNDKFAETLREIRIKKEMSQQQLADMLCVERSTIAGWETGRRIPNITFIRQLAACLIVDISVFIDNPGADTDNVNVLVLDDERLILNGSVQILKENLPGAMVTGFTRSSEALAYAKENRITLAFVDIELGRTNGLEVCRKLLDINPRTNVIYLTAYADYSFDAWDTGACGFALKPLSKEVLQKQLSRLRYPLTSV